VPALSLDGDRGGALSGRRGAVQARKSILEDAVGAALGQSAEVLALRERPELGPLGGIAATLRF